MSRRVSQYGRRMGSNLGRNFNTLKKNYTWLQTKIVFREIHSYGFSFSDGGWVSLLQLQFLVRGSERSAAVTNVETNWASWSMIVYD